MTLTTSKMSTLAIMAIPTRVMMRRLLNGRRALALCAGLALLAGLVVWLTVDNPFPLPHAVTAKPILVETTPSVKKVVSYTADREHVVERIRPNEDQSPLDQESSVRVTVVLQDAASGALITNASVRIAFPGGKPYMHASTDNSGETSFLLAEPKAVVRINAKGYAVARRRVKRSALMTPERIMLHRVSPVTIIMMDVAGRRIPEQWITAKLVANDKAPAAVKTELEIHANADGVAKGELVTGEWEFESLGTRARQTCTATRVIGHGEIVEFDMIAKLLPLPEYVSGVLAESVMIGGPPPEKLVVEVKNGTDGVVFSDGEWYVHSMPKASRFRVRLRTARSYRPTRTGSWIYIGPGAHGVQICW